MGNYILTLMRVGKDTKGEEIGILKVLDENSNYITAFSTRENDKNLSHSSLRVGIYEMVHSMKTHNLDGTPSSNPKRCLRPTIENIKSVLIHAAENDNPNTLSGCIAPGIFGNVNDFINSELAMQQLFEEIGTYEEGKKVTLKVLSNATGVGNGSKDDWWRTK